MTTEDVEFRLVLDTGKAERERKKMKRGEDRDDRAGGRRDLSERTDAASKQRDRSKLIVATKGAAKVAAGGVVAAGIGLILAPILSEATEKIAESVPDIPFVFDESDRRKMQSDLKAEIDEKVDQLQELIANAQAFFATISQGTQAAKAFSSLQNVPSLDVQKNLASAIFNVNKRQSKFKADINESLLRLGTRGILDAISGKTQSDIKKQMQNTPGP